MRIAVAVLKVEGPVSLIGLPIRIASHDAPAGGNTGQKIIQRRGGHQARQWIDTIGETQATTMVRIEKLIYPRATIFDANFIIVRPRRIGVVVEHLPVRILAAPGNRLIRANLRIRTNIDDGQSKVS